jgi:hypothetical protein
VENGFRRRDRSVRASKTLEIALDIDGIDVNEHHRFDLINIKND